MRISYDVGYVDIDIDLNDFDSDDLQEELEARGFVVLEEGDDYAFGGSLNREEARLLQDLIQAQGIIPGTPLYFIYEKLNSI
jgi:hypothetical protein